MLVRVIPNTGLTEVSLDLVDAFKKGSSTISIGRSPSASLNLQALDHLARTSRKHAELRMKAQHIELVDVGSKSGT